MKNVLGTTDAMRKKTAIGERTTDGTTDERTVKILLQEHNHDDRGRCDNRDRPDNDENDHRRHHHDDDVGPRHGHRQTTSTDWHSGRRCLPTTRSMASKLTSLGFA